MPVSMWKYQQLSRRDDWRIWYCKAQAYLLFLKLLSGPDLEIEEISGYLA